MVGPWIMMMAQARKKAERKQMVGTLTKQRNTQNQNPSLQPRGLIRIFFLRHKMYQSHQTEGRGRVDGKAQCLGEGVRIMNYRSTLVA